MNGTIQVGHSTDNQDVMVVIDGEKALRMLCSDAIDLGCSLIRNAVGAMSETLTEAQLADAMRMLDIVNYWGSLAAADPAEGDH